LGIVHVASPQPVGQAIAAFPLRENKVRESAFNLKPAALPIVV
jgi:hypothetical protein